MFMAKKSKKNPELIKLKRQFDKQLEDMRQACLIEKVDILTETELKIKEALKKRKKQERYMKGALIIVIILILFILDIKDQSIIFEIIKLFFGV